VKQVLAVVDFSEATEYVTGLAAELRSRDVKARARLMQGPTVDKIREETERCGADLIVLGSRGRVAAGPCGVRH